MKQRYLAGAVLVAALAMLAGCQNCREQKPPPEKPAALDGLHAVPSDVQVVIGADVKGLSSSFLINRAIAQMMRREQEVSQRVKQLTEACKFDLARDLDRIVVALHPGATGDETEEAMAVLTGRFVEAELASCMSQYVAGDGGTFTFEKVAGRTFYRIGEQGESATRWLTVTSPRTLVVATSRGLLARAVGSGEKLASANEQPMAVLLARVDHKAPLWGAGLVDAKIGAGIVELTGGQVASPPQSFFGEMHPQRGLRVSFAAEMHSAKDAKYLSSLIKTQLELGLWWLQGHGMGTVGAKLSVDSEEKTVFLRLSLSDEELKEALARIDTMRSSEQDPPSK